MAAHQTDFDTVFGHKTNIDAAFIIAIDEHDLLVGLPLYFVQNDL